MSILLEDEISRAKADAVRHGATCAMVQAWEVFSRHIITRLGFDNAEHVRRVADKFGRRTA